MKDLLAQIDNQEELLKALGLYNNSWQIRLNLRRKLINFWYS